MNEHSRPAPERPWLKSYPPGIDWHAPISTRPVHEKVRDVCARQPEMPALDFLGRVTRYGELGRQIEALAGALQADLGVAKGDRVALLMPNTPFYVVAYYALLSIGAIVVNCNPLYSRDELAHVVANSGARVLVTVDLRLTFESAEHLAATGPVETLVVARFADALPVATAMMFRLAKGKTLAKPERSPVVSRVVWFADLLARKRVPAPVAIDPATDIAVQQYTGGTTGIPKGAMLSHANIAANTDQIDKWGGTLFYAPSRVAAVLPFFHIFAMTTSLNAPLGSGGQVIMLPRFEMGPFLKLLRRTRPHVMSAVPTLLHALATSPKCTSDHLSSLRVAVSGGAPLPDETRDAFARKSSAILGEGYGLTEASPVVTCAPLDKPSKRGSIGLPFPGTDVKFMDLEAPDTELPLGERGQIVVKGPQVMLGYFDDPDATRAAFTPDGYLRTGDVGYVDADGFVFLVDRIKDLIISSGFNVYPRMIEDAIYKHDAVDETCVIGVKDTYRGEIPVAYVKLKEGQALAAEDLITFLRARLSKLEMPREIIFRDELPKTMIGKLSRTDLRADYERTKRPEEGMGT